MNNFQEALNEVKIDKAVQALNKIGISCSNEEGDLKTMLKIIQEIEKEPIKYNKY